MQNQQAPVNLNLFTIRFPVPAVASILHRLSGVILLIALPFLLALLKQSLASQGEFNHVQTVLAVGSNQLILLGFFSALWYHFLAGIRHLLMDMGCWEEFNQGRITALIVMILTIILTIMTGFWLW